MTGRILTLDPDLAEAGAAVLDRGAVVAVAVISAPAAPPAPCPLACSPVCAHAALEARGPLALAAAVLEWLAPRPGDVVIIEAQYIGRMTGRRFDPGPLLGLSWLAGAVAAGAAARGARVLRVPPVTWRGVVSKPELHCAILASLDEDERGLLPRGPRSGKYLGDPLDAAGLALWTVGRLGRLLADPGDFAQLVEPDRSPARRRKGGAARALRQRALPLWPAAGAA